MRQVNESNVAHILTSYTHIYERYPEWDGTPDHVVTLMGPILYELWEKAPNEWLWLDYYFDTGLSRPTRHEAILDGANLSCYWANNYEEFERRRDKELKAEIIKKYTTKRQ